MLLCKGRFLLLQVTRDGIPVIWHDDEVLTFLEPSSAPEVRRICDLTLEEFKQLSPAHSSHCSQPAAAQNCRTQNGVDSAAAESAANASRIGSHAQASTRVEAGTGLGRRFNSEKGERIGHALPWAVSEDDELPTLAEVFKVGINMQHKCLHGSPPLYSMPG